MWCYFNHPLLGDVTMMYYSIGKEYVCVLRLHDAIKSEAVLAQVYSNTTTTLNSNILG